jgi:hypothetical protein
MLIVSQNNCTQLVCRQCRQPRSSALNTKILTWTSSAFSSPVTAKPGNSELASRSAQTEAIWGQSTSFIRFAIASVLAQFDQFAYKDCDFIVLSWSLPTVEDEKSLVLAWPWRSYGGSASNTNFIARLLNDAVLLGSLTLQMKALWSSKTSGNRRSVTKHHIPKDVNSKSNVKAVVSHLWIAPDHLCDFLGPQISFRYFAHSFRAWRFGTTAAQWRRTARVWKTLAWETET